MRQSRSVLFALCASLLLSCLAANSATEGAIKVLVVFPQQLEASKVYMMTDGELARGLTIPFAMIASNLHAKHRSEELGPQLDATLQGYDRYATVHEALEKRFAQRSAAFELVQTRDMPKYVADKGISTAAAAEAYGYVIVIEDKFSGLSILNLATKTDDLAPFTTLGYQVFASSTTTCSRSFSW